MKNFPYLMFFLVLSILSCSTDDQLNDPSTNEKVEATSTVSQRIAPYSAENRNNPFENAGRIYSAVLDQYDNVLMGSNFQNNIQALEVAANSFPDFMALKPGNHYTSVSSQTIKNIMDNTYSLEDALYDATLSSNGKLVLANFILDLENEVMTQSRETVHAFVIDFEDSLSQQGNLTDNDLRILFSTTSILRHAISYDSNEDRDKKWGSIKVGITAAVNGLCQDTSKGVLSASIVKILQEQ